MKPKRSPSNTSNNTFGDKQTRADTEAFEFVGTRLDTRVLSLHYRLIEKDGNALDFIERLDLPSTLPAPNPDDPTVQALLRGILLCFGVSYYKARLPGRMEGITLHPEEFEFWTTLYSEGMGEFYFRNDIPIPSDVGFVSAPSDIDTPPPTPTPPEKPLILMGGGKDSAVVADLVHRLNIPSEALALGDSAWIRSSTEAAGLQLHTIQRRIDPRLFELNQQGAYNGHVPISACIAFIAALVGYTGGFSDILVGNERGADDANTIDHGRAINHQWSKSSRFERLFQAWCERFAPQAPRYSSLLRPLSEIRIAKLFAEIDPQHGHFTSCNRNFRQKPEDRPARWCGRCAKCVFVSLVLAPHLSPAQHDTVFGEPPFWQLSENRILLRELLGLEAVKPWDCVGTPKECGLSLLAYRQDHNLPADIEALVTELPSDLTLHFDKHWAEEMALSNPSTLSPLWMTRLHAILDPH